MYHAVPETTPYENVKTIVCSYIIIEPSLHYRPQWYLARDTAVVVLQYCCYSITRYLVYGILLWYYFCYRSLKGPRRPYYNHIFFFVFLKKMSSRIIYAISSMIVACETRITQNGILPEPNLRMVSFIS